MGTRSASPSGNQCGRPRLPWVAKSVRTAPVATVNSLSWLLTDGSNDAKMMVLLSGDQAGVRRPATVMFALIEVRSSADECELFAVGREADGSVYIAQDLLRIAAEHGHFIERAEKLIFLGCFGEINVIAVGRKSEAVEDAHGRREDLHIAAGGHLADHQALHFAVAQHVDNVLAVRRNGYAGRFAGFGELHDAHILRVEGVLVAARFEDKESDGGSDERDYGDCGNQFTFVFCCFAQDDRGAAR